MSNKYLEIGALWLKRDKNGDAFYSGEVNGFGGHLYLRPEKQNEAGTAPAFTLHYRAGSAPNPAPASGGASRGGSGAAPPEGNRR